MFLENPLFGVGTGNYAKEVAKPEYLGKKEHTMNLFVHLPNIVTWIIILDSLLLFQQYGLIKSSKRNIQAIRMTLLVVFLAYTAVNGIKPLIQPITSLYE